MQLVLTGKYLGVNGLQSASSAKQISKQVWKCYGYGLLHLVAVNSSIGNCLSMMLVLTRNRAQLCSVQRWNLQLKHWSGSIGTTRQGHISDELLGQISVA